MALLGCTCVFRGFWFGLLMLAVAGAAGQDAPMPAAGPKHSTAPTQQSDPAPIQQAPAAAPVAQNPAAANYDKSIFQKTIPPDQLTFLKQFDGAPSGSVMKDKQFRKLLKSVEPDCEFHYGRDKPLDSAMDEVIEGSRVPVQVRDGRFVMVAGAMGSYLRGRGFLWFDMQEGIALGGFYFTPTNGEPSPALNIFSRMVRETTLSLGQLPPDFAMDLIRWTSVAGAPPVEVRYFLTGSNKKIVLEHDEDYCLAWDGSRLPPESGCQQMAADAADLDLSAAYYTDATHHATNATAWMLSDDQVEFVSVRDRTCRIGPDPLGCRIRLTRERTRTIIRGGPRPRPVRR